MERNLRIEKTWGLNRSISKIHCNHNDTSRFGAVKNPRLILSASLSNKKITDIQWHITHLLSPSALDAINVRVIEKATLFDLADALLNAIGFELDHTFGFHSSLKSPCDKKMDREYTVFADQGDARMSSDTGVEKTLIGEVFK